MKKSLVLSCLCLSSCFSFNSNYDLDPEIVEREFNHAILELESGIHTKEKNDIALMVRELENLRDKILLSVDDRAKVVENYHDYRKISGCLRVWSPFRTNVLKVQDSLVHKYMNVRDRVLAKNRSFERKSEMLSRSIYDVNSVYIPTMKMENVIFFQKNCWFFKEHINEMLTYYIRKNYSRERVKKIKEKYGDKYTENFKKIRNIKYNNSDYFTEFGKAD